MGLVPGVGIGGGGINDRRYWTRAGGNREEMAREAMSCEGGRSITGIASGDRCSNLKLLIKDSRAPFKGWRGVPGV